MAKDKDYTAKMDRILADLSSDEPSDVSAPTFIDEQLQNGKLAWGVTYKTSAGGRGPKQK